MSQATEKLSKLMQNLKKLPANRRTYYLNKLKELDKLIKTIEQARTKELSYDETQSDWLLDLANWLDKQYQKPGQVVKDKFDELTLSYANRLDSVYNAVADEVAKVPETTGKAIGKLTGTGDYWPYLLGAAVALGAVYYVKNIA